MIRCLFQYQRNMMATTSAVRFQFVEFFRGVLNPKTLMCVCAHQLLISDLVVNIWFYLSKTDLFSGETSFRENSVFELAKSEIQLHQSWANLLQMKNQRCPKISEILKYVMLFAYCYNLLHQNWLYFIDMMYIKRFNPSENTVFSVNVLFLIVKEILQ